MGVIVLTTIVFVCLSAVPWVRNTHHKYVPLDRKIFIDRSDRYNSVFSSVTIASLDGLVSFSEVKQCRTILTVRLVAVVVTWVYIILENGYRKSRSTFAANDYAFAHHQELWLPIFMSIAYVIQLYLPVITLRPFYSVVLPWTYTRKVPIHVELVSKSNFYQLLDVLIVVSLQAF